MSKKATRKPSQSPVVEETPSTQPSTLETAAATVVANNPALAEAIARREADLAAKNGEPAPAPTEPHHTCGVCATLLPQSAMTKIAGVWYCADQVECSKRRDAQNPKSLREKLSAATEQATQKREAKTKRQAEKANKPATTRTYKHADDHVITVLVAANPKKAGSASYDRFAHYVSGMTVAEALKAGVTRGDLEWDSAENRKFIAIGPKNESTESTEESK